MCSNRDTLAAILQACLLRRRMRAGSAVGHAVALHQAEMQQECRDGVQHTGRGSKALTELRTALQVRTTACLECSANIGQFAELCNWPAQETLSQSERLTPQFMRSLDSAGWDLARVVVEAEKRRGVW
jgi:hypothetical protein